MTGLTICIGYDSKEPLALQVLAHSITTRASGPVSIVPVAKQHLKEVYTRDDPRATTEFSLTRFLSPWLAGYEGFVLFMDCDMLVLTDIYTIFDAMQPHRGKSVYCCQHDYTPNPHAKATGVQLAYPRKNWSSVMLFDARQVRNRLTPEYVNSAEPRDLHRFTWLPDDELGSLPLEWNWLVGEYEPNPDAFNLHYTLGTPCFPGYEDSDMSELWWDEYRRMLTPMKTYKWTAADVWAKAIGVAR
jgi:hypothetical protein